MRVASATRTAARCKSTFYVYSYGLRVSNGARVTVSVSLHLQSTTAGWAVSSMFDMCTFLCFSTVYNDRIENTPRRETVSRPPHKLRAVADHVWRRPPARRPGAGRARTVFRVRFRPNSLFRERCHSARVYAACIEKATPGYFWRPLIAEFSGRQAAVQSASPPRREGEPASLPRACVVSRALLSTPSLWTMTVLA